MCANGFRFRLIWFHPKLKSSKLKTNLHRDARKFSICLKEWRKEFYARYFLCFPFMLFHILFSFCVNNLRMSLLMAVLQKEEKFRIHKENEGEKLFFLLNNKKKSSNVFFWNFLYSIIFDTFRGVCVQKGRRKKIVFHFSI